MGITKNTEILADIFIQIRATVEEAKTIMMLIGPDELEAKMVEWILSQKTLPTVEEIQAVAIEMHCKYHNINI